MNPDAPQLLDSLRAVRDRWRLVLLVVGLTTAVALVLSLASEKRYDATAQLLLRGEEPINSLLDPSSAGRSDDPERDLNTEVELITVGPTAHAVKRRLGLGRSTDDLIDQIKTDTSATSDIVGLRARDRDPVMAARIANAFAEAYVQFRVNSARARYRQAADLAARQLAALSDRRPPVRAGPRPPGAPARAADRVRAADRRRRARPARERPRERVAAAAEAQRRARPLPRARARRRRRPRPEPRRPPLQGRARGRGVLRPAGPRRDPAPDAPRRRARRPRAARGLRPARREPPAGVVGERAAR